MMQIVEGVSNAVLFTSVVVIVLMYIATKFAYRLYHQTVNSAIMQFYALVQSLLTTIPSRTEGTHESNAQHNTTTDTTTEQPSLQYTDGQCPICLGTVAFAITTNCGHVFCATCIVQFWQIGGSLLTPLSCPVCRRTVTLMMPSAQRSQERHEAARIAHDYNRRFGDQSHSIAEYIRDLPYLVPHILNRLTSVEGFILLFRTRVFLCIIGAVLYALLPFDFLPEALFGIVGFIDDALVMTCLAAAASVFYRQFLAQQQFDN